MKDTPMEERPSYGVATFSAGCFWDAEAAFRKLPGVVATMTGYTGGSVPEPDYEQVSSGTTGHAEAVQVIFDPGKVTYRQLLGYFWRMHDPTQINRQGPDVGSQYRSAIFYSDGKQKEEAENSKKEFDAKKVFDKPAATVIAPLEKFYPAEEYHQDYYDKHPGLVCHGLRKE